MITFEKDKMIVEKDKELKEAWMRLNELEDELREKDQIIHKL